MKKNTSSFSKIYTDLNSAGEAIDMTLYNAVISGVTNIQNYNQMLMEVSEEISEEEVLQLLDKLLDYGELYINYFAATVDAFSLSTKKLTKLINGERNLSNELSEKLNSYLEESVQNSAMAPMTPLLSTKFIISSSTPTKLDSPGYLESPPSWKGSTRNSPSSYDSPICLVKPSKDVFAVLTTTITEPSISSKADLESSDDEDDQRFLAHP